MTRIAQMRFSSGAQPSAVRRPESREERFEGCFRAHYGRVLAYGLRRLPDRTAAEDVAAETFLVAWRRLDEMSSDPLVWLLAIARNVVYNERRSSRRRERLTARLTIEPAAPDGALGPDASPAASDVIRALKRLDERDREVLLLITWDGLDRRRSAAVLGCSPGTFAVRLHRARTRLARELHRAASVPTTIATIKEM